MEKLTLKKWEDDRVSGIVLKREGDKTLNIDFSGALDLHFTLRNYGDDSSFIIAKDNYYVYEIFEKLYNDILNGNVFEPMSDLEIDLLLDECAWFSKDYHEVLKNKLDEEEKNRKDFKEKARKIGLVVDNKIIWRSDDYDVDVAPFVVIEKLCNCFKLSFGKPEVKRELNFEEEFMLLSPHFISVRFRNSGSRYNFFNVCFMRAYNTLREVSNNMDQIHIEEYLIDRDLENGIKLERILK